ncbi:MAG TPA: helix-turn-helix domain-containing protein [Solirubrobacterales bacterium]|nr:helix-turn-helix domain-containing protein [Solirubrobacterales bacterium]
MPLNVHVLNALEVEELPLADLSKTVGHPPATTMRAYLKSLVDFGAIERRQEDGFAGTVAYSLTAPGQKLLVLAAVLQNWLLGAPDGPVALGSPAAKSVIKALVEGWNATIVRILAARPLALTELARLVPSISYPTLERRVAAMRRVGLLQASRQNGASRGTPYRVTRWLREAAAPLTAAVAWERCCAREQTKAIGRLDVEASFLLAAPLLELPTDGTGVCRLGVEMRVDSKLEYAGAMLEVDGGRLISCSARLEGRPGGWATGTVGDWFGWTNRNPGSELEFGGDVVLARAVAEAMRSALLPTTLVGIS